MPSIHAGARVAPITEDRLAATTVRDAKQSQPDESLDHALEWRHHSSRSSEGSSLGESLVLLRLRCASTMQPLGMQTGIADRGGDRNGEGRQRFGAWLGRTRECRDPRGRVVALRGKHW